ncbi:MAG: transposase, family [Clostridia bacterium]|nr:transposase, family [Clostridia bacterium]
MAIPLMEYLKETYGDTFVVKNYIMDKGYDVKEIYRKVYEELKAQVIISINPRGAYAPPEGLDENAAPVCSMGYSMVYWGYDETYNASSKEKRHICRIFISDFISLNLFFMSLMNSAD